MKPVSCVDKRLLPGRNVERWKGHLPVTRRSTSSGEEFSSGVVQYTCKHLLPCPYRDKYNLVCRS